MTRAGLLLRGGCLTGALLRVVCEPVLPSARLDCCAFCCAQHGRGCSRFELSFRRPGAVPQLTCPSPLTATSSRVSSLLPLAASPRFDFGVSPNCAGRLRKRRSGWRRGRHGFGVTCRGGRLRSHNRQCRVAARFSGLQTTGFRGCSHSQSQQSDDPLTSGTIYGGRSMATWIRSRIWRSKFTEHPTL